MRERGHEGMRGGDRKASLPADNATPTPVQLVYDVQHITASGLQPQLTQKAIDVGWSQHPSTALIHLQQR